MEHTIVWPIVYDAVKYNPEPQIWGAYIPFLCIITKYYLYVRVVNIIQSNNNHVTMLLSNINNLSLTPLHDCQMMMTSSNGNILRVTGPLCGEFTGPGEFPTQRPVTQSFNVFFDLRPNKQLSIQPWGWWFRTPSWSLWHSVMYYQKWVTHISWFMISLSVIPSSMYRTSVLYSFKYIVLPMISPNIYWPDEHLLDFEYINGGLWGAYCDNFEQNERWYDATALTWSKF